MKKLMRNGRHGKVLKMTKAEVARRAADAKILSSRTHSMEVPGLRINLYNPYAAGPFGIKSVTVMRRRNGEMVEVNKQCLHDCHGRPIAFGPRKWLARQLKKYELEYSKFIMTQGTAAEGL